MAPISVRQQVEAFLNGEPFAVAGASTNRAKYGNKALRAYLQAGLRAFPINPNEPVVEGLHAVPSLLDLSEPVHGLSIITPPHITEKVVKDALQAGIKHIWMQPGAESDNAVELARARGVNVIAGDACILVVLGFRDH